MVWLKALWVSLRLMFHPLKHTESIVGWVQMIIAVLILIGIITGGIVIPDYRWLITIVAPVAIAILAVIALVRSQKRILDIESPIDAIMQKLESEMVGGFSMLGIFDALRDDFALGLTYPQIHNVLISKLSRDVAWGIYSSDILTTFTTLKLIHSSSIDPSHSVLLDNQRTIPNYVYQLTDIGKLLAHKLMRPKPKIGKEGSQT